MKSLIFFFAKYISIYIEITINKTNDSVVVVIQDTSILDRYCYSTEKSC